jgi:molybdopterin/thiamine biosynthesis adenylyltransferase
MAQGKLTNLDHGQEWPLFLQDARRKANLESNESWRPTVIDMSRPGAIAELEQLVGNESIARVVDNYDEQYAELIVSRQPGLYQSSYEEKVRILEGELIRHHADSHAWQKGSWVWYPWNGQLVHLIARELFLELRSIRNRNLITAEEQQRLENFNVGCVGMSVGSNAALAIAIGGTSQRLKIADGAAISGSNLNRVLAVASDVGLSKSLIAARKLYEMNPYISIERFGVDITLENITQFFEKPWPVHVVVDEVDNLKVKLQLRVEARKRRLPVIMATDLGDDVMLDVERFDLHPNLPFFHGLVDDIEDLLVKDFDSKEWLRRATAIIGSKNVPLRMQQSIMQIGRELSTQPQLGGTAIMAGAVVAYAVRKIALNEPLKSGRTIISLDEYLLEGHSSAEYQALHRESSEKLERIFDL